MCCTMNAVYTPGLKVDHYEIIRQLGHGGMSRVYLATDIHTQQTVVLKFLNDDLIGNVAVFERYKREAAIVNRINHPHLYHMLHTYQHHTAVNLLLYYI